MRVSAPRTLSALSLSRPRRLTHSTAYAGRSILHCSSPGSVRSRASCSRSGRPVERPWTYTSGVRRPSGSRKTWWLAFSLKRTTLSSMDGQYRGPFDAAQPPYVGVSCRFSSISRCVSAVVWVM